MSKQEYSRRKFIHHLGGTAALMTGNVVLSPTSFLATEGMASSQQNMRFAEEVRIAFIGKNGIEQPDSVEVENRVFRLEIKTKNGLNPHTLFDKKNNVILANGDY